MKKLLIILMSAALTVSIAACGSGDSTPSETQSAEPETTVDTTQEMILDFDGSSYSEMGEGTFALQTPSGSSEDGSVPYIYVDSDLIMTDVGYTGFDVDGSHLTYIYVDGMSQGSEQISDYQGSISLTDGLLDEGVHKVEFVQYDTDDPSGAVIMYKTASFEIKSK